mgnify:CR=1 FL=1
MNHSQFLELCRDISAELNCEDLDELGFSNYVEIDDIPIAFIFDEHSMSEERIFRVQYKKNKTWQSYTPWYGLKILGEYYRDQKMSEQSIAPIVQKT